MLRTAIIHAGLPKTGTTTIQKALFANRDRLLSEAGVLYPWTTAFHSEPLSAIFGPSPAVMKEMMGLGKPGQSLEDFQTEAKGILEGQLNGPGWELLILSAEDLANFSHRELIPLRDWLSGWIDRFRIITWVRDPIAYTVSNIQQMVKGGYLIDDMVMNKPGSKAVPNLSGRTNQQSEAFGQDAIEIQTLEDAAAEPGGIVAAFCRRIGLSDELAASLAVNGPRAENQSISLRAVYAINELNSVRPLLVNNSINPERSVYDATIIAAVLDGEKFDLPSEAKALIRQNVRADIEKVNSRFGLALYPDVFGSETLIGTDRPADLAGLRELAIRISNANKGR